MVDLMLVRAALRDPAIAAYPDFARAISNMCDQLERFRSERGYIIGFNDGWEEAKELTAALNGLLRHLERMQSNAIRAGETAWHPNSAIAESIETVRALAATRSASAITSKGTSE